MHVVLTENIYTNKTGNTNILIYLIILIPGLDIFFSLLVVRCLVSGNSHPSLNEKYS